MTLEEFIEELNKLDISLTSDQLNQLNSGNLPKETICNSKT